MVTLNPRQLRQRLAAFLIAGLGGLVAAGISLATALYDAAHPPAIPERKAGEVIDTGRWEIVLHRATTGTIPPTGIKPFTPKPLLMVEFDARNLSAEPSNVLAPLFAFEPAGPDMRMASFYLARDKYFAGALNPNMPERVIGAWEWPEGVEVPQELKITFKGQTYKQKDNLYGASGWYDGEPAATVSLPVERSEP